MEAIYKAGTTGDASGCAGISATVGGDHSLGDKCWGDIHCAGAVAAAEKFAEFAQSLSKQCAELAEKKKPA
jgi:hypothetical protein